MPTSITKSRKHFRNRRENFLRNQPEKAAPILITLAERVGVVLGLTFDQPVALSGTPAYTCGAVSAVSAVQSAPNAVEITFSGVLVAATPVVIPYQDPAIRNASGGFVTPNTVTPTAG